MRITACASADARREPTIHRPAARREAAQASPKHRWPPDRDGRGPEAAGGQLHALVSQGSGLKGRAGSLGAKDDLRSRTSCLPTSSGGAASLEAGARCSNQDRRPPAGERNVRMNPRRRRPAKQGAPPATRATEVPLRPDGAPRRPDQRWAEANENRGGSSSGQHRRTPRADARDQIASSSQSKVIAAAG